MSFSEDFKQFLLSTFPDARPASGGKEVVMKCRFCGDKRDPRSKHLYISLGHDNKPTMYNCFLCNEAGIMTSKKLRMLESFDIGMCVILDSRNNEILKLPSNRIYKDNVYNIYNKFISDSERSYMKLDYINQRIGQNLSFNDLIQNKIVLNISDLLESNRIYSYTRRDDIMRQLDEHFIGFLSMDNSYLTMRNLSIDQTSAPINMRYVNYNIFNKIDTSKRHYFIPNEVDLLSIDPIQIHVAEGAFDILSVRYNLRKDMFNKIFAGIGGKSYLNILKLFIQDLGIINCEFHIYIDNDIDDWVLSNIYNFMRVFDLNIFIHKNIFPGEKDFGVPLHRITEQIKLLGA